MKNMKLKHSSLGFAHLILILAVIVIAGVGFAGYYVASSNRDKKSANTATNTNQVIPEKINSDQDLEQARKALDADQDDSDLDPAQLDADLNGLL
jgi:uncharacterized protein (UPF0333 family)